MSGAHDNDLYDVAIVGGGLAGPAVAIALAREGHRVCLVDQHASADEDRWGLNLWPPAFRVLRWLGLLDSLEGRFAPLQSFVFEDPRGHSLLTIDVDDLGPLGSFISLRPSVLQQALKAACDGVDMRMQRKVVALHTHARETTLQMQGPEGVETLRARVVIGCDGANSKLRSLAGLQARSFRYPLQTTYSAIGGRFDHAGVVHVLGNGWAVSASPIEEQASWLAVTFNGKRNPRELLATVAACDSRFAQASDSLVREVTVRPASVSVPCWERDRLVLMGEAAHAYLPQLGLGGSQSLEDVPAMVDMLRRALRDDDLSATRLREFRAVRRARVDYTRRLSLFWAGVVAAPAGFARDAALCQVGKHPERARQLVMQLCDGDSPGLLQQARTLYAW